MTSSAFNTAAWCELLAKTPSPLLTWYGEGRIELSGPVLARWVAKTDNFLAEEFPFDGNLVHLDLPRSWRRLLWETTCLLRGWKASEAAAADLVVSSSAEVVVQAIQAGQVGVAQATASLALCWPGVLPAGALDGIAEVMGQPDAPVAPAPAVALPELDLPATAVAGARIVLTTREPDLLALQALHLWRAGACAVVIEDADPVVSQRLAAQERVAGSWD